MAGIEGSKMDRIRVANRCIEIDDYFISAHNRGKLINKFDWNEFEEAKQMYRAALLKFQIKYEEQTK